jgi:hypothetical protein
VAGAWSQAEIAAEADRLDAELGLAATRARRALPGLPPVGGRVRSAGVPPAAAAAPSPNLEFLLAGLVDAVRALVETQREVVRLAACSLAIRLLTSCQAGLAAWAWPGEDSGEEAPASEEEEEDEDEEDDE